MPGSFPFLRATTALNRECQSRGFAVASGWVFLGMFVEECQGRWIRKALSKALAFL
jgi:hypothetical protein